METQLLPAVSQLKTLPMSTNHKLINRYLLVQNGPSALRDPNEVHLDIVPSMRRNSIELLAANYIKVVA